MFVFLKYNYSFRARNRTSHQRSTNQNWSTWHPKLVATIGRRIGPDKCVMIDGRALELTDYSNEIKWNER